MNDFKGSVAEQDITISTDVQKESVVGGNFYQSILYVTDRFEDFGGETPVYPVVTSKTYKDVLDNYAFLSASEKKLVSNNLASLFAFADDVRVYIIPSTLYEKYKMKGYFAYIDLEWFTTDGTASDYALQAGSQATMTAMKTFDKNFTRPITELPVNPAKMSGTDATTTEVDFSVLSNYGLDAAIFARPAMPSGAVGSANAYLDANGDAIGYSPALYQLGRTLSRYNESGVSVGSAFDMDAVPYQNVLPTADDADDELEGPSAYMADWFEARRINYFKPVGNGKGNVNNFGGWTLLNNCVGAEWIVAYENYMNRVSCATIITSGKSFKNVRTYGALLDAVIVNMKGMINSGRVESFKLNAPQFNNIPKSDGHTIVIPDAWTGVYVDNVRKVRISGALTVSA